jgi:NADH dehydrogenase
MGERTLFITGATGFIGKHLVDLLLRDGYSLVCFVKESERDMSFVQSLPARGVRVLFGDITDAASVLNAFKRCKKIDAVIHLAALIKPTAKGDQEFWDINVTGTGNVIAACEKQRVKRLIFYSTDFVVYNYPTVYGITKAKAEELLRASALNYTILRPTPVYGVGDDKNFNTLIALIKKFPVLPSVSCMMQPVSVLDVVSATRAVLHNARTFCKAYNLPGGSIVSFTRILRILADELGKERLIMPLPNKLVQWAVRLYERVVPQPVVRDYQISKWLITKPVSIDENRRDFGYAPMPFDYGIRATLRAEGISQKSK